LATIWLLEDNKFVKEWKSLASKRRVKVLGIEATLATKERAEALGIDLRAYAESMYAGCLADTRRMARLVGHLSSLLAKKSSVLITTRSGTNLRFGLDNRPIESSNGVVTDAEIEVSRPVFLPAGAVGTTVDEQSADGIVVYDHPIRRWNGTIRGLKLWVKRGRITDYTTSTGLASFKEYLENNGEFADRFAFIGFGLNSKLQLGYTQDDKVLGSIELNFGENESRGGTNIGGGNFWGVATGADVLIDGLAVMKSGRLLSD
jgi:leucyl aminopeptidase (aminopeptidase T)